jgi:hypothetical protein
MESILDSSVAFLDTLKSILYTQKRSVNMKKEWKWGRQADENGREEI